jgi:uncharacterized protein YjbI with pentapeptide repeats
VRTLYRQLNKGVDAWNEWRSQNPQVDVNLRGASLSNKYFKGTNLYKANLIKGGSRVQ